MNQQPSSPQQNHSALAARLQQYGLAVVLLLFIMLALLYGFTVPYFEKPDELKHFAVIQYLQSHGQLPLVRHGEYKPWDQEGTQPPLYHLLAAVAAAGLDLSAFAEPPRNPHYADDRSFVWRERGNNNLYLHPPDKAWRTDPVLLAAQIARGLSLLAGLATIALTYGLAKIIFGNDSLPPGQSASAGFTPGPTGWIPLLAATLVAFNPQFLHTSSAITNDGLAATLAAAGLVGLVLVIKRGASGRYALLLGAILGLAAITKLSLLYLAPLVGLVFGVDAWRRRSLRGLLLHGAIITGAMLLLSGWWFWRNWQLYGDVTALNAHLLYRGGALNPTPSLAEIWRTEMVGLELSFWAAFGAGQVLLEPWLYTALAGLKYVALAGIAIGVGRSIHRRVVGQVNRTAPDLSLLLLAVWALLIFAALLRWMQITPASWGRLLYPALPALAVLAAWGLTQFAWLGTRFPGDDSGSPVNRAARLLLMAIPWLAGLALVALAAVVPFRYLRAAYTPAPLITEADLPADAIRLDFTFGDEALRLVGYRVADGAVQPGQWLPVTLYWQATRPIAKNYSAFVHLLTPAGESIAQSNSYPDGGRWPTSMLPAGAILADTHAVFVPPEVFAPAATRLALGIFEFDDPQRAAKPAVNAAGAPVTPIVDGPPLTPAQWPVLQPSIPLAADFAGQIQLIGYDWIDRPVKAGQTAELTLYWQTLSPPGQDLTLFIQWVDEQTGAPVAGFDGPPNFPTGYWQAGNTFIDARSLVAPGDVAPGRYRLVVGWYNLQDFGRLLLADGGDSLPLVEVIVE